MNPFIPHPSSFIPYVTMTKKFLRILLLIAALFFVVRIILFRQLSGSPLFDILILDSEFYFNWARLLASGQGHPPGPFWLSPLYPFFMAGIFTTIGTSVKLVVFIQFLLSLGTLILLTLFTRKLLGNTVALVTAGLAAFYSPWLYYDGVILSASLILFLNAAILYLVVTYTPLLSPREQVDAKRVVPAWIAIGVLVGLSALARPSFVMFALLIVIWIVKPWLKKTPSIHPMNRGAGRTGLKLQITSLALFVVGILVVLAPALIRNWAIAGSPVLTTSSGGINFFIGNRSGATGIYDEFTFIESFDPWREAEGFRAEASKREGRELTLTQASRYWGGQALRDIVVDPLDWAVLLGKKLWLTMQREEIPNNLSFRGVAGFAPIVGALPLRWGLLFPLAAAGAFLLLRRRHESRTLILLYAGTYALTTLLFFSSSEYRFPLILVLLPCAAYLFVSLWQMIEQKQIRDIVTVCVVYLAALVITNIPTQQVRIAASPRGDYMNLATVAVDFNMIAESIPLYARALAVDESYQAARLGLAQSLWKMGNFDQAREEYLRAGVAPPDAISGEPLNRFLEQLFQYTEDLDYKGALEFIDRTFPRDQQAPAEIWNQRALVESKLGMNDRAIDALLKAAAKDPENPQWLYRAGLLAQQSGDRARADTLFRQAIDKYGAYAPARLELAFKALADKDLNAAKAELRELERIYIPDDSVKLKLETLKREVKALELELSRTENY